MKRYQFVSRSQDARVLCVSTRAFAPVIARCLRYEFEDVACAVDAVDVIAPADALRSVDGGSALQAGLRDLRRVAAKTLCRAELIVEGAFPFAVRRRLPEEVSRDY